MKNETIPGFSKMPRSYPCLCRLFLPRPIRDRRTYEKISRVVSIFAEFKNEMSVDQRDYIDLLGEILARYEEIARVRGSRNPRKLLKRLIEEHKMRIADLSPILGKSLSLGSMILSGQRTITPEHAVRLADYFGIRPDEFLIK
jgi:antitoxin component HigA of HigAB toxin-antitoxin module|tara:strand:+ start:2332 stop:2760 length:429 start_codon:yes stop_codon:yes gene_type:complete